MSNIIARAHRSDRHKLVFRLDDQAWATACAALGVFNDPVPLSTPSIQFKQATLLGPHDPVGLRLSAPLLSLPGLTVHRWLTGLRAAP